MKNMTFRKPAAVLAAVVLCVALSAAAFAVTGAGQGFFRDLIRWDGAVVGASYEQATDEIRVDVSVHGDLLRILASFANPRKAPYSETETLGIADYRIVDAYGKVLRQGTAEAAAVVDGQAEINISLDGLDRGSYRLVITAFVSEKKADQPLHIRGSWESSFTR